MEYRNSSVKCLPGVIGSVALAQLAQVDHGANGYILSCKQNSEDR